MSAYRPSPLHDAAIWRDFAYLIANFVLGTLYFSLLMTGYMIALPLALLIIGIPLLRLMGRASRWMAAFDRQVGRVMLAGGTLDEDEMRAAAASYAAGEAVTYLLMRWVTGIIAITLAGTIFPFLLAEMLVNEAGVRTGMITAQINRLVARGLAGVSPESAFDDEPFDERPTVYAPREKPKNDALYADLDDVETVYVLDDDGEIRKAKRS